MTLAPSIRVATLSDVSSVLVVTQQAFTPSKAQLSPASTVFEETTCDLEQAISSVTVYVAQDGDSTVGTVRARPSKKLEGLYCYRLAVLPSLWRRGVGSALMERVEQHARSSGLTSVVVKVRLGMPGNLLFFCKRGYIIEGRGGRASCPTPTCSILRKYVVHKEIWETNDK